MRDAPGAAASGPCRLRATRPRGIALALLATSALAGCVLTLDGPYTRARADGGATADRPTPSPDAPRDARLEDDARREDRVEMDAPRDAAGDVLELDVAKPDVPVLGDGEVEASIEASVPDALPDAVIAVDGAVDAGTPCTVSCPGTMVCCAGHCVSLAINEANCGGCGVPCPAGEVCEAGACRRCLTGLLLCGGGEARCCLLGALCLTPCGL